MFKLMRIVPALAAVIVAGLVSVSAYAVSFQDAKSQGLVGELPNGYIAAVQPNPSPDIQQLVNDVNLKRREVYRQKATANKWSLDQVEAVAGKTQVENAKSGEYIKTSVGGAWTKVP
jgi:uncharacterized protein YdbL (DUF1318 family)